MKQTKEQVEARHSLAWGRPSTVVAYHLYGNRLTYAARDDGNHWMPLETSWDGGRQLFEPVGMDWPSTDGKAWVDAVNRAAALARDHFIEQRNPDALKRLPRAKAAAK